MVALLDALGAGGEAEVAAGETPSLQAVLDLPGGPLVL